MPTKLKNIVSIFCLIVSLPICAHSQKNAPENDNLNKNLKNEEAPQPRYPLLEVLSETSMVRKRCQEESIDESDAYRCKNLEKRFYCASHYVSDKQKDRIQKRINRGKFSWHANASFNDYNELAIYYFCACSFTYDILGLGEFEWSKDVIEAESSHFDYMLHVQKSLHNKYPGEDNTAGKRYRYDWSLAKEMDKPILNEKPAGYVNNFDELDALPYIQTYCQRIGSKECDFISAVLYCRYFSQKAAEDDIKEVYKKMAYGTYTKSDLDFKSKMEQTLNFCQPFFRVKSESDAQDLQRRMMNAAIQTCSKFDLTNEQTIHETAQLLSMLHNK